MICNHCRLFAALWRPGNFWSNFCIFVTMTPYIKIFKILFRNFSPPRRSTLFCSNFVKCCRREIGEIMHYLLDKENNISAASQTVVIAWIAPKIRQGQPPTMHSQCSRFHPNLFTFGRVIAKHVNTVFWPSSSSP